MDPRPEPEVASLRVPPHSTEAEQSVLGGLMLDNDGWDRVGDLLDDDDFYRHEHRLIYGAIGALVNSLKVADIITVYELLQRSGKGDECGGMGYLNSLCGSVPSAAGVRRYAMIVREKAVERRLISKLDEAAAVAWGTGSTAEKVDAVATMMHGIEEARSDDKPTPIDQLVVQCLDDITEAHENGGKIPGSPTGLKALDEIIGGWEPERVYTLAARPSLGKSSLALFFASHQALNLGVPVLIFSLEMGKKQVTSRLISLVGAIHGTHLRNGTLSDDEWGRLSEAVEKIGKVTMLIDDRAAPRMMALRRKARSVPKIGLIVIDYLQLCGTDPKHDSRANAIGEVSRGTKQLARDLKCPVLQLSQLNRRVDERPGQRPQMSDLREAGDIEQDSDVIMFLRRHRSFGREYDVLALDIAKNRDGPLGDLALNFRKPYNQWTPSTVDIHAKPDATQAAPAGEFE